jgi:hypothetical protein
VVEDGIILVDIGLVALEGVLDIVPALVPSAGEIR